jgi:hypothetical protein
MQSESKLSSPADYTYRKCVEWLPGMSVVRLELECRYELPIKGKTMEQMCHFMHQLTGLSRDSSLTEIANETVLCKVMKGITRVRHPRRIGLIDGTSLSFILNITGVDREDAVDIIQVDELREDMHKAVRRSMCLDGVKPGAETPAE